ncbi:MAG: hypothetical protein HZA14_11915 [Nitrospirae bacterium]|nr:hypothetical protein [Nitrospirota bacterium]
MTYAEPKTINGERIPVQEILDISATETGIEMTLGGKPLIAPSKGLVFVLVEPGTGKVLDQANFDISKEDEAIRIALFLRMAPRGSFLFGGLSGSLAGFTEMERFLLEKSFERFGLSFPQVQGWTFIGREGAAPGTGIQASGSVTSHTKTEGVLAVDANQLAAGAVGLPASLAGENSIRADELSDGMTPLASLADGKATAYRKNFVDSDPGSGFYRVRPTVDFDIARESDEWVNDFADSLLDLVADRSEVYVYFDGRYPSNWISEVGSIRLKSALVGKGVRVIDADQLAELMRINPQAAVIMAQDIAPDTILGLDQVSTFDAYHITSWLGDLESGGEPLVEKFLKSGGTMVWMHDIPFYYVGLPSGEKIQVGREPQYNILGVRPSAITSRPLPVEIQTVTNDLIGDALRIQLPLEALVGWRKFESALASSPLDAKTALVTELDASGEPLNILRADGSTVTYESGRIRFVRDAGGRDLITYDYTEEGKIAKITYHGTDEEIPEAIEKERESIMKKRNALVSILPEQEEWMIRQIDEEEARIVAIIQQEISRLQAQRYQTITVRSGFLGLSKKKVTVEVPGVAQAIGELQGQLSQVRRESEEARNSVRSQIEEQRLKVEAEAQAGLDGLVNREAELRRAILLSEVMPVLIETYRELVGRDPSVLEIESVIPASEPGSSVFDIVAIRNQLTNSDERRLKLERNERIISLVETLLKSREHDLGAEEITNILEWLRTRNMHMGESAFGPLRELLKSNGIDVPEEQLAAEVIVEDIISGVINPTTEGELMLSLNALDKVAGLHGLETGSYKAAFDALPQGEFIAWINENHYVLVKSIADGKVTYFDRSIGENGSEITMNLEEFRAIYSGVILSAEEYQQSDRLTERETQAIKGSFFGIDDLIFAMVIGVIIGAVTGTVISAIQGGSIWKGALIGGIAGLVGGFTAGLGSMFSSVPALFGSQALGNAVAAIGTYASAVSLGSFAGQLTAGFLGEYGLANVLGTVSQISGIIGLASTATLGIANIFQGGFQAGLANIWDGIKSIGGKIWNGITTVASTIGNLAKGFGNLLTGIKDFAFNALPNLKGNLLSNLIEFGKNTFSVIGQGVVKGVEWLGGKFGGLFGKVLGSGSPNSIISLDTVKSLRSNLVNIAIGNATAKTLDDLGLDPTLARLGTAIATGGLTSPENFLGGSLKNLLLAGSNELALHLDLPPPLAESLNMITGLVSENLIDPKSTNIFDGISKIMPSLFTNGITYLGTEIGLSPTVSTLIAGPLGYGLGSLATDLVTGAKSQDIFSHLSQEFGRGLASAGAKIGITKLYDAIDAPPIVEGAGGLIGSSFLDVLLSGQFGASINTATFADAFLRSTVQITGKLALNTSALYQLATTSDLPGTLSGILGSTLSQQAIETMVNTAGDIGSYIGQKLYEIGTKIYEMNIGELKVKLDLIKKELLIEEAKKIKSINFEDVTSEEDLLRKIKITTLDETPDGIKVLTRSEGGKTTEILFSQSEEELLNARPFDDIRLDSDFLRIRPTAQDRYGNFVSGEVETGLAKWVIEENQLKQQQVKEHVWAENYTLASGGADTAVWIQAGEFYDLSAKGFVENISYSPEMLGFIREAIDLGAEYLDVGGGLASVVFRTGMSQQAKDLLGSYLQFQSQTGKKVAEWTLDYTALVQEPSKVSTYASGVGQMDMHLNWFMNGPADLIHRPLTVALDVITGARSISRGSADFFANRRWWNATQEAGLKIAETLRQSETNFMFTPGVNSSGLTETELIQLREAFGPTTKKIAYGHSAGTEALLNALPYMTDQEKANTIFVFASPRMNREAFIDQIQAAGLKPEQVIVMGSSGDLPHTPVVDAAKIQTNPLGLPVFQFADIIKDGLTLADDTFTGAWRDYSAGGAQAYQYVFLERDETAKQSGGKIKDILDHGSMFNGVLTPHRYNINVNGTVQTNELISKVLTDMANQLDQNSGNDNDQ